MLMVGKGTIPEGAPEKDAAKEGIAHDVELPATQAESQIVWYSVTFRYPGASGPLF